MRDLLGSPMAAVAGDTLYRCLDRLPEHKRAFFSFLRSPRETLFEARFADATVAGGPAVHGLPVLRYAAGELALGGLGHDVGRGRARSPVAAVNWRTVHPGPRTTKPGPGHEVYTYRILRALETRDPSGFLDAAWLGPHARRLAEELATKPDLGRWRSAALLARDEYADLGKVSDLIHALTEGSHYAPPGVFLEYKHPATY